MITVGVSIVVRGIALLAWGTSPYSLPAFTKGPPLDILGAAVSLQRVWIVVTALFALSFLYFLLERTLLGKAVRACAINRQAAGLMGISASQMSMLVFGLSAALGAIGGIVIAPLMLASYDMGLMLGLKVKDIDCAFKLFRRKMFEQVSLEYTGAMISTEMLVKIVKQGFGRL